VSTARPLAATKAVLEAEGIDFAFSDVTVVGASAEKAVKQQARGTHADEIETSMMLYIRPDRVDMTKAVKDDNDGPAGRLTRRKDAPAGTYSASGTWGDATLATREKGRIVVEGMVADILAEIEALRRKPRR
jgi:creatinine amidohydrolase